MTGDPRDPTTIRIVTDSLAWLPDGVVSANNISVVPLHVTFGEEQFTETVDLTNAEFYRRLRAGGKPTTSQPSPGEFLDCYRRVAPGASAVISIHASAKLSGTVRSAEVAAQTAREEFPGVRFEVIDTQLIAPAEGMVVLGAARAVSAGKSVDEIVAQVVATSPHMRAFICPDTIEYLIRGGRVGRIPGMIGTLLNLRPILALVDGGITPRERVRTRTRAMERMIELIADDVPSGHLGHIGLMHAEAPEARDEFRRRVEGRFRIDEVIEVEIGPVLGTHAGPGAIGITYHAANALG